MLVPFWDSPLIYVHVSLCLYIYMYIWFIYRYIYLYAYLYMYMCIFLVFFRKTSLYWSSEVVSSLTGTTCWLWLTCHSPDTHHTSNSGPRLYLAPLSKMGGGVWYSGLLPLEALRSLGQCWIDITAFLAFCFTCVTQGSYTTWKVRESHGIWFANLEIYQWNETPGKSWNFNIENYTSNLNPSS